MKYFSYQNGYGHQTFQGGDMLRGALTHKYAWHFNGVVLWDYVTDEVNVSTCKRCMDIALSKLLT